MVPASDNDFTLPTYVIMAFHIAVDMGYCKQLRPYLASSSGHPGQKLRVYIEKAETQEACSILMQPLLELA